MPIPSLFKKKGSDAHTASGDTTPRHDGSASPAAFDGITEKKHKGGDVEKMETDNSRVSLLRPYTFAVAAIVSIGGFIFGYGEWYHCKQG